MKRANHGYAERLRFIQQRFDLYAVLTDNIRVIAAVFRHVRCRFVGKYVAVQCAEAAECVGGIERFLCHVICDHHLGPMNKRRHDKGEDVSAGAECVALLDEMCA